MKTLKIEIPQGYEVDSFDKQTGELRFKEMPKEITDRIKSFLDAVAYLGPADEEVINYRTLTSAFGMQDNHLVNYQAAVVITKALNEKWVPDWNDDSQGKYYPWFEIGGSSGFQYNDYGHWNSTSGVGSRLCFKSGNLARYAGEQFTEIYKNFMTITAKQNGQATTTENI